RGVTRAQRARACLARLHGGGSEQRHRGDPRDRRARGGDRPRGVRCGHAGDGRPDPAQGAAQPQSQSQDDPGVGLRRGCLRKEPARRRPVHVPGQALHAQATRRHGEGCHGGLSGFCYPGRNSEWGMVSGEWTRRYFAIHYSPFTTHVLYGRQKMTQSRRTVIQAAGAGLVAQLAAGEAHAQGEAQAQGDIWRGEYWANKGDVKLALYRKRASAPKAGEPPLPVLFLVHGSSISAGPSMDLTVPGRGEYSVMNVFARWGFDVWAMDHENYGRSSRTSGNSDIASGVEDLKAATEVVRRETGRERLHFCGESSGALRAGAFAMVEPERV